MADIIEGAHPTRMELLEINKRMVLAEKGHKLLEEKRDSLMMEFLKIIKDVKNNRSELAKTMETAYSSMVSAEAVMGSMNVAAIASSTPCSELIELQMGNIMGVKTPKITLTEHETAKGKYSLAFTSSKLDDAVDDFGEVLEQMIHLIETEESIRRMGEEIKKTKRRVNTLQYLMIPRLKNTQKYIRMRLEEMERENFFRLKTVKKRKDEEKESS